MKRPSSITGKLAVLFASATIALIAITNLVLFHFVEQQWNRYDERNIELAMGALQLASNSARSISELAGRETALMRSLGNNGRIGFAIVDSSGNTLLSALRQEIPPALIRRAESTGETQRWDGAGSHAYDVVVASATTALGQPLKLVLALQVTSRVYMGRLIAEVLLGITIACGAVAALLGWIVARQGLEPLRRFAEATGRITARRLSQRLDPSESPDELREMAESFNRMLDRLQDSFRRIEQFSSDIAHELRTPINNLLGQTQVALSRARSAEEYREVLELNAEEYERLSRMIQDMLFIARAEEARGALDLHPVELREEARRIAEFYEPMLEERRLQVECRGSGVALIDRALVDRAIGNLLSNASRHASEGTKVEIEISVDPVMPDRVALSVTNRGADIAAEHLPRLFDRFYRVDPSRSAAAAGEGTGLGLAIVKTIAELHEGAVSAESAWGRTRFTLHLPAATQESLAGPGAPRLTPALSSPP